MVQSPMSVPIRLAIWMNCWKVYPLTIITGKKAPSKAAFLNYICWACRRGKGRGTRDEDRSYVAQVPLTTLPYTPYLIPQNPSFIPLISPKTPKLPYPPNTPTMTPFTLRPWQIEDLESLVHNANNYEIARNLTDRFSPSLFREGRQSLYWLCQCRGSASYSCNRCRWQRGRRYRHSSARRYFLQKWRDGLLVGRGILGARDHLPSHPTNG